MDLSFSLVILQHQMWKIRLRSMLDNKEKISLEETGTHKTCQLGQWLYSEGIAKYGSQPEMTELEEIHADFHNEVRNIVELKNRGKLDEAEKEYSKIVKISAQVIDLLETMEARLS